jgi:hypothetical protein
VGAGVTQIKNPAPDRPERIQRGLASTLRATGRGITVRDAGVDVEPVWDMVLGQGLKATDLGDGAVRVDASGGSGSSGNQSSAPIPMLNNSGQDLLVGDVVVVDETADQAVTVTTTAGDTRIAGVVQEPIADGDTGLVLFNGYAALVNAPDAVRGEYAQTSTTAAQADSTADREAGSFAVYLTGTDFPDFATSSVTTELNVSGTSLEIDMPATIPAARALFLGLWLESGTSAIDVDGWTLIGAEAGFYYFYKVSEGDDTATATWTGASVAVATVLLLHENVFLGDPVETHDYDTTTSAATVGSLDTDVARYAIAGVDEDVASPGSGFTRLGGGTAGIAASSGTPALVQSKISKEGVGGPGQPTFDATITEGNVMITVPFSTNTDDTYSTDPRQGGTCPQDTNMTDFGVESTNRFTQSGRNAIAMLGKTITDDTYSGPFGTMSGCSSNETALLLMEFENIGLADYEVASANDSTSSPVDLGTFTVGGDDLVIMAVGWKQDGYGGSPDPTITPNGFTQVVDSYQVTNGWMWVGYKVGDGDASITFTNNVGDWAAVAIHLGQGAASAKGTLAGKYIGHDASATSPFTGAGQQDDAIFVVPLTLDAKPSALLYGPDLGGGDAAAHIADTSDAHDASAISVADAGGYFAGSDVEAVLAELGAGARGWTDHGSAGATETISLATGHHRVVLSANLTVTFADAVSGDSYFALVDYVGDGTIRTVGYSGSTVTWVGDALSHPGTLNAVVSVIYRTTDGGTNVVAQVAGGSATTSPLTTKGDLWGYDTADARVPVGANGYLLVADSTDAQGVVWENPETTGHWELLMDGGSPPEPLEDGSGTDWLYTWVP